MKTNIFITGATGFLGSHIAELLCQKKHLVIATKRGKSGFKSCLDFYDQIIWIDTEEIGWEKRVEVYKPEIIVHAAWSGVSAEERDNWSVQTENLIFLDCLLKIAKNSGTKKIIGLGSQAEYGYIDTLVKETDPLRPNSSYGAVKVIASQLLSKFCDKNHIEWYWFRLFSTFGEREGNKWLFPQLIQNILNSRIQSMALSPCDQQYAYLYVHDFSEAIYRVIESREKHCGIYNICSNNPTPLKEILIYIRDTMKSNLILNFGDLPYREGQSMFMAGDTTRFVNLFGDISVTSLHKGLDKIIHFHTEKHLSESL